MPRAYKKINTGSYETSVIQDYIEQALQPVLSSQIIDGILLKDITLDSTIVNNVSHKLQRVPQFWILARQNTNAVVWEVTAQTTNNILALQCSANCTVSLWVG